MRQRAKQFCGAGSRRWASQHRNEGGTLLGVKREGYLVEYALLQSGPFSSQHHIEIQGSRVKLIPVRTRRNQGVNTLHMRR